MYITQSVASWRPSSLRLSSSVRAKVDASSPPAPGKTSRPKRQASEGGSPGAQASSARRIRVEPRMPKGRSPPDLPRSFCTGFQSALRCSRLPSSRSSGSSQDDPGASRLVSTSERTSSCSLVSFCAMKGSRSAKAAAGSRSAFASRSSSRMPFLRLPAFFPLVSFFFFSSCSK